MQFRFDTPYELLLNIVKEKHDQLKDIMEDVDIDCWIVFLRETSLTPDPIQNLVIGGDVVWDSAFIFYLNANEFHKIAIVGNFDADAEKNKGIWTRVEAYVQSISDVLSEIITELNPNKVALNFSKDDEASDGLSHGLYLKLSNYIPNYKEKFMSASPIIQKLRARKTLKEIELVRNACIMTEEINQEIQNKLKPEMTETRIQEIFHSAMNERGVIEAWQRKSCPAIDAGPDKSFGHVGPTDNVTKLGHSLHNDFGVQLYGYTSDIQRMWFFGTRDNIPHELIHGFSTVYEAISNAANFIKPGVKGYEVDKIARDSVIGKGYEEYKHALGHQVGRAAHDGGTTLGPLWEKYGNKPKGRLEKGNIFTLELYVKTKNYGMVSLEEVILVTDVGCEFLVPRQEDWICIS